MTAGSTTFPILSVGGPDNGQGSTLNTQAGVAFIRTVTVSAGGRDKTITLPDNAFLHASNGFVTVACSSLSQGGKILLGDGSTDTQYGTTNGVQAVGQYLSTLTKEAVSAKTIVVKVTASVAASAAQFTEGKINVTIIGGIIRG